MKALLVLFSLLVASVVMANSENVQCSPPYQEDGKLVKNCSAESIYEITNEEYLNLTKPGCVVNESAKSINSTCPVDKAAVVEI